MRRLFNSIEETSTPHIVHCANGQFEQFHSEVISKSHLKALSLVPGGIIPLSLIEGLVLDEELLTELVLIAVQLALNCVQCRNIVCGFLSRSFVQWAK